MPRIQLLLTVVFSGIAILAALLLYHIGLFKWLDHAFYDLRFKWRGAGRTSGNIVLVLRDEKSADALNRMKGSWSRIQLAEAVTHLCQAGAEVIGLDLVLSDPDPDPKADAILAKAINGCNNVILARVASAYGDEIRPLPAFQDAMIADGFIDLPPDDVIRRIFYLNPKRLPDGRLQLYPAFFLELARSYRNLEYELDFSDDKYNFLGAKNEQRLRIPKNELLINYHGYYWAFPYMSYVDVVRNRFPPEAVRGKIVLIGSSLVIEKDIFSTPFSRFHSSEEEYGGKFETLLEGIQGYKDLGVSIHAHAAETLLSGEIPEPMAPSNVMVLTLLVGAAGIFFYIPRFGMIWASGSLLCGLLLIVSVSYAAFLSSLLCVDIAPMLIVLLAQFVMGVAVQKTFERKRTAFITSIFGKYVSPSVVDELIKGDISATLEGSSRELTILFSDLRGFTPLAEELGAKNTAELLNAYFGSMIPIVFEHQGTLDKLMGDAVMAFFGAPVTVSNHPVRAVEAALSMLQSIHQLKNTGITGVDRLHAGIGINTGVVTVGNLGSREQMEYTVIGDAVNLTSRLEGLTKVYKVRIIVSESTALRLDDRFLLRELDKVRVKGKGGAVTIFEVVGYRYQMDSCDFERVDLFHAALSKYRDGALDEADEIFQNVLDIHPEDGPSRAFRKRIKRFREAPPADDWDGVITFDQK